MPFIIKHKTLTLGDEVAKGLRTSKGLDDTPTSQGNNFCIQSLVGAHGSTLERPR